MITNLFGVASTTDMLTLMSQNISTLIALAVGAILVILAALLGLGYGISKFTGHISGTGFSESLHAQNVKSYIQIKNSELYNLGGSDGSKARNQDELESFLYH